jgi:putative tryptophan/tyrosine transport system substrate-binding protein
MMSNHVHRRSFIALLSGTASAWALVARAQQDGRVRRIGVLMARAESDPEGMDEIKAFREGLQKLGRLEGHNVRIDYRWAGAPSHLQVYAAELVEMTPEVLFAGSASALAALQQATRTLPIVFARVSDPIANGFVTSVARPSGNITGFAMNETETILKWPELLKQIAPRTTRVAFVYDPASANGSRYLAEVEAAAHSFGVQVSGVALRGAAEIERAINAFAREPNGGLVVQSSPAANVHRNQIIALAARHRLPAVYGFRYFVAQGGLASYGANPIDSLRGAASYVDRILKGERPGDLPVQFATRFELIVNNTTAKALGLELPLAVLIRADEVIE